MTKDKFKTQVLFRFWIGEVIALFPYEIADHKGHVMSYQHVGQHGGADYSGIIQNSKPATKKQYKDLKKELESNFGYKFEMVKRRNYDKYLDAYNNIRNN